MTINNVFSVLTEMKNFTGISQRLRKEFASWSDKDFANWKSQHPEVEKDWFENQTQFDGPIGKPQEKAKVEPKEKSEPKAKTTEKTKRMGEYGLNPDQYEKVKKSLKPYGISIADFGRLKERAKKVGISTFPEFGLAVKKAQEKGMKIDDYIDELMASGTSKFQQDVKDNLKNQPKQETRRSDLGAKVREAAEFAKTGPIVKVAKRFLLNTKEKVLEIISKGFASHTRPKEELNEIIRKIHHYEGQLYNTNEHDPYASFNKRQLEYYKKQREEFESGNEWNKTRDQDYKLSETPVLVQADDGAPVRAFELMIGKGQKNPYKTGETKEYDSNETDRDRVQKFFDREADRKGVDPKEVKRDYYETYKSGALQRRLGSNATYEQIKKDFTAYMLSVVMNRKMGNIYSNSDNTYYVTEGIYNEVAAALGAKPTQKKTTIIVKKQRKAAESFSTSPEAEEVHRRFPGADAHNVEYNKAMRIALAKYNKRKGK